MPDARLEERHARKAAMGLERALELARANCQPPDEDVRETAALLAAAVPLTAVNLPLLLLAAGPQVARAVKVEARRLAAIRLDPGGAGSAGSVLTVREAARMAGVSCQAIRTAAAAGRFAGARKSPVTGAWQIPAAGLEVWMEERNAA